jgi:phosphoribosylanthranilate isomerase
MDSKAKLKICGITTKREIEFLNRMAVDYIGFVFAKSKRRVTVDQVKKLRECLRADIQVVGVFVNESPEKINEIADACSLDIVQLHGQETADEMKQIKATIWNAVGVKTKKDIRLAEKSLDAVVPQVEAILLDYRDAGSGQSFDWSLIPKERQYRLVLAGGINVNNVREAMERVEPDVIDVSSGVEENGKKSEELVSRFIRRVKANE